MTEEPYRWLEAMENRREYIREQLKPASPVFAISLSEGILLLGVGNAGGGGKVFEIFDRHGMAALGHAADIERVRQGLIDAAHLESFTRAPEDVSLRRLVSYGLSTRMKDQFEQIYSAPLLVECLIAEVGRSADEDLLARVSFDGSFSFQKSGACVAASSAAYEKACAAWMAAKMEPSPPLDQARALLLAAWALADSAEPPGTDAFEASLTGRAWAPKLAGKALESALLSRDPGRAASYHALSPEI